MFTPQQLEQITFHTSVFGGYDMDSVDEFLVALIEDYNTLYKDNATLKSKMRVLVEKLVGTTEDTAPVPRSPRVDSNTTSRFTNLQFGKNYDPTKR